MKSTDNKSVRAVTPSAAKRQSEGVGFAAASLTGLIGGIAAGMLLLLIAAAAAYSTSDPDPLSFPLSVAALYCGMFAGGVAASRISKKAAIAESAVAATATNALMLAVSAFIGAHNAYPLWAKLLLHAGIFAAFMLGALAARPRKRTSKNVRHAIKRRAAR